MSLWGFSTDDNYESWTVTIPNADVTSYIATALAYGNYPMLNKKVSQVTATTMAGGMTSIQVRVQDLIYDPPHEEVEPPDPDPEDEPTEEEEEAAGEGTNNAKVIACDVTFQECPLPTHPYFADLAENDNAIRDAIGMVHKGANIY